MARHFIVLATAEVTSRIDLKQGPMSKDQVDAAIAAGVEAFPHGYAASPRRAPQR